ncbi:cell wall-binding repeat-containing protein [Micromonospora sp. NPDC048170]|uniref:cell wall-binding repeat-containing protein n=1 Tax=Micromonospora sp. NPDC048170 TaxID=3154819 RepID=UPI0033D05F59
MPRTSFRRRSAFCATLLAVGATTLFGGGDAALATHRGGGSVTTSNGTKVLSSTAENRDLVAEDQTITDAAWSPDGSRAVFVTGNHQIATIGDSRAIYPIAGPQNGVRRATPEWVGDGSTVIWAAKADGTPWRIEEAASTYGWDIARRSPNDGHHYFQPDTNNSQRIVVQRQADDGSGNPTGTPEIGFLDGSAYTRIITDAASPSVSPDGTRVAFIRGGQVWTADSSGANPAQLTTGGTQKSDPVINGDNRSVLYRHGTQVAVTNSTGQTVVHQVPAGVPDSRPHTSDRVVRLAGTDRFSTATAISKSHWATAGNSSDARPRASVAVLSRSDNFADALGGSALAAAKQGPLLMTPTASLQPAAGAELTRILAPGSRVYLLGSAAGALSPAVESQVRALGFNPVRIAGSDRFATSVAIANAIDPTPDMVLTATGMNFPDALAAGAAAGAQNLPGKGTSAVVVLTNDGLLPDATRNYLDALPDQSDIYGVGLWGDIATRPYNGIPLAGADRFETALLIAWSFFGGQNHIGVATGMNWPDALAGGALMASLDAPLMLTPGNAPAVGDAVIELSDEMSGSVQTGLIFGSAAVVNNAQLTGLGVWICGPGGYVSQTNATNVFRTPGRTTEDARTTGAKVHTLQDRADRIAAAEAARKRLADR